MCGWDPSLSRARPVVLWCCGVRRVLWDRVGAPVVGVVVYPPPGNGMCAQGFCTFTWILQGFIYFLSYLWLQHITEEESVGEAPPSRFRHKEAHIVKVAPQ